MRELLPGDIYTSSNSDDVKCFCYVVVQNAHSTYTRVSSKGILKTNTKVYNVPAIRARNVAFQTSEN
jgi:hypothetical protein